MKRVHQSLSLLLLLLVSAGFTIALTYAPCYASLCSEEFFGLQTRIHIAIYYALIAGIAAALALRACSTKCALISNAYLSNRRLPLINRQVSIGGLSLAICIISVTLLTTPLWIHAELDFWGLRADPLGWTDAKIRLAVTGVLGHHADILIGLVIIPVGRHSLLAEGFNLHQGTLLFAHKLVAYLMVVASLTHGVAYFTFVGAYKASKVNSAREEAFSVDNPTLTLSGSRQRGHWYSATFPTGVLAIILMLAITHYHSAPNFTTPKLQRVLLHACLLQPSHLHHGELSREHRLLFPVTWTPPLDGRLGMAHLPRRQWLGMQSRRNNSMCWRRMVQDIAAGEHE
ncbi:hypothetical protein LTR53_010631 [Teratosphaeriaceae sp. CCFEE 6253]|nr:hypothetical protein LTR53_010631 [Teratosphaeriaceae sp. CCFEE 6253]